jgi:hypothetical protein
MIQYVTFKKYYRSNRDDYKFIPKVKYMLKGEDSKYYITIKDVRLPKKSQHSLYEIHSIKY